ncbi:MAG: translation elongation factor Ts [Streptosporangiaceae bacterium]
MANVSAADVKRLREITAAGMMDCKNALQDADGDMDKAIETLRLKGAKDVGKRESRTASNGLVMAHLEGTSLGVLVEVNSETDFVAKNDRFKALGSQLAAQIAKERPADVSTLLETETGDGTTVAELVKDTAAALGEKIEVRRFAILDDGYIASYLHRTSSDLPPTIGVLVELTGDQPEVAKEIAQHIAAMSPHYVSRDEVPAETVEQERRLAERMARDEGKPEKAVPKIVEGRVGAYFKDFVLLEQPFVKDGKKSVGAVLEEVGVGLTRFVRFKVGQA